MTGSNSSKRSKKGMNEDFPNSCPVWDISLTDFDRYVTHANKEARDQKRAAAAEKKQSKS